jgi:AcrR family transcriptional regulator
MLERATKKPVSIEPAGAGPRPGRPVVLAQSERRRLLFDAAAEIFIGNSYAASTMGAIAARAGMSKKTLYQLFPSKLALFDALLADRMQQPPLVVEPAGATQAERLTHVLLEIANFLLRPDRTDLIRLIVADGQAFPELMTAFERLRMQPYLSSVEHWLHRECAAGALRVGNVPDAARFLFGMIVAEPALLALLRAPPLENEPTIEQRVRMGVGIFLHGIGALA